MISLINELEQYNPELLDKGRVLAITKSDLLDDELECAISKNLPDIPTVFISSVSGKGIDTLKDLLWNELDKDIVMSMTHRSMDVKIIAQEDKLDSSIDFDLDNDKEKEEFDDDWFGEEDL